MTFSTGIFLTAVRFYEPLFRNLFIESLYEIMGKLYEPQMSDGMSYEEFKLQNQAMNSILASSLNVELVYVILKSVTSFSKMELASSDMDETSRMSGLVITEDQKQEPIQEINLDASADALEQQVRSECKKERKQVLQQIEIKMVDNLEQKGLGEFMHTNFDAMEFENKKSLGKNQRNQSITTVGSKT